MSPLVKLQSIVSMPIYTSISPTPICLRHQSPLYRSDRLGTLAYTTPAKEQFQNLALVTWHLVETPRIITVKWQMKFRQRQLFSVIHSPVSKSGGKPSNHTKPRTSEVFLRTLHLAAAAITMTRERNLCVFGLEFDICAREPMATSVPHSVSRVESAVSVH